MKIVKIIGHPVSVMCIYLLLIISGESIGGFYALYLMLGLPEGTSYALVSALGVGLMLIGYNVYRKRYHPLKPSFYVLADVVMIIGLVIFFQTTKGYNNGTFRQAVPLFSFALFGLCALCNVLLSVWLLIQNKGNNVKPISTS
jgi:hypothetical protein